MCWSGETSTAIATIGFVGAALEYKKAIKIDPDLGLSEIESDGYLSKHRLRAVTIFYFALMELLQAYNYLYIDKPGPMNSLGAFLGFLHISFQPIATIWYILSFLPKSRAAYWFNKSTIIAIISSLMLLMKVIINPSLPGCFAQQCSVGKDFLDNLLGNGIMGCSPDMVFRTYRGEWHISWQWAYNACGYIASGGYFFVAFILPFFCGSYRISIFTFILGPFFAYFLTGNPDEWAAIWCLLSVGFLIIAIMPPVEKFMTVKHESWVDTIKWLRATMKK